MPVASSMLQDASINERRAYASDTGIVSVDELIRTLVVKAGKGGVTEAATETQEIILDTDVDGARYLLVRVPQSKGPAPSLSPREQEIVRMVSKGFPNKVIAGVLNISSWTVSTHVRRIFAKLGVTSRAQMVAQVLEVQTKRKQVAGQNVRETGAQLERKAG